MTKQSFFSRSLLSLAMAFRFGGMAAAQETTGSISGTIRDSAAAVLTAHLSQHWTQTATSVERTLATSGFDFDYPNA